MTDSIKVSPLEDIIVAHRLLEGTLDKVGLNFYTFTQLVQQCPTELEADDIYSALQGIVGNLSTLEKSLALHLEVLGLDSIEKFGDNIESTIDATTDINNLDIEETQKEIEKKEEEQNIIEGDYFTPGVRTG